MKILIPILIACFFLINVGCDKSKTTEVDDSDNNDTLCVDCPDNTDTLCVNHQLPGDYFPAYPGTIWNYKTIKNEIVKYEISETYLVCEGECRPVFLNLDKCIQGSAFIQRFYAGLGTSSTIESAIYSMTVDSILICPISFSTFKETNVFIDFEEVPYRRITLVKDTILILSDNEIFEDVIIVYEYNIYTKEHRYFDYFSKGIGLVKRDSVNVNDTTDLIEILRLIDYNIGK